MHYESRASLFTLRWGHVLLASWLVGMLALAFWLWHGGSWHDGAQGRITSSLRQYSSYTYEIGNICRFNYSYVIYKHCYVMSCNNLCNTKVRFIIVHLSSENYMMWPMNIDVILVICLATGLV